jgi:hypothetical protein
MPRHDEIGITIKSVAPVGLVTETEEKKYRDAVTLERIEEWLGAVMKWRCEGRRSPWPEQ